jgi:hypothetical protein
MQSWARWVGWALLGGIMIAGAALPVGARTEREGRPAVAVMVRFGDSLWTLAREHGDPRRDVRDVVGAMMRLNRVQPGELQPGSVIAIPAEYAKASDANVLLPLRGTTVSALVQEGGDCGILPRAASQRR